MLTILFLLQKFRNLYLALPHNRLHTEFKLAEFKLAEFKLAEFKLAKFELPEFRLAGLHMKG